MNRAISEALLGLDKLGESLRKLNVWLMGSAGCIAQIRQALLSQFFF
jgi:hypothetical protein